MSEPTYLYLTTRGRRTGLPREIRRRSTRKYGWGDGLIVELMSAPKARRSV